MKPLARCPQCKYSLKGLPANHNCPECGFEYDADTTIWESCLAKTDIAALVLGTCFVIWMFLGNFLNGRFPPTSLLEIVVFFLCALLAFVLYRGFVTSRAGYSVCTTGEGLLIKIGKDVKLYPWGNVEAVFGYAPSKISGVKIKDRDRPLYIRSVLRKQADFEDFEHEVHRRKQAAEGGSC